MPLCITYTSCAACHTTPMSWVMSSTARSRSIASEEIRARIAFCVVTSSAVVGSSAMSTLGRLMIAMAIITRCSWPPDSSCGYDDHTRSASSSPTSRSCSSTLALRSAALSCFWWYLSDSATCTPSVNTGLNAVDGSWNTVPMYSPRMRCSGASAASRSMPRPAASLPSPPGPESGPSSTRASSRYAWPFTLATDGSRRGSAIAVTDLPEPDSPTRAVMRPGNSLRLTPWVTSRSSKLTARPSTVTIARGSLIGSSLDAQALECVRRAPADHAAGARRMRMPAQFALASETCV